MIASIGVDSRERFSHEITTIGGRGRERERSSLPLLENRRVARVTSFEIQGREIYVCLRQTLFVNVMTIVERLSKDNLVDDRRDKLRRVDTCEKTRRKRRRWR